MDNTIYLKELSKLYPTIDACLSKIASLRAELALSKATIHVISDVHGEFKKLRHVVNNASGSLKPIIEEMFCSKLGTEDRQQLLNLIYYPFETYEFLSSNFKNSEEKIAFINKKLLLEFEVFKHLAKKRFLQDCEQILPKDYKNVFLEILFSANEDNLRQYVQTLTEHFVEQRKEVELLRMVARVIRNLFISELIVAGDLGDRGPRIDKVIDYIMHQPNVSLVWGNHDASWLGACLGDLSCIATVLRISLRYRRLSQLEEGYGIPMAALEKLARTAYGNDLCERFPCKGEGLRDDLLMSRMQKAIAIIQFKLEGQSIRRNPVFKLEDRNLLHLINPKEFSIELNGKNYKLLDSNFPTVDWNNPYQLTAEEETCMRRLQDSFLYSPVLWDHFRYVVNKGSMYLVRDGHLIFHACVPVNESGEFLEFEVDGKMYKGKALFDALGNVIQRVIRHREQKDLDMLWYLWGGPLSPFFGKDKMATFETYFIDDAELQHEEKNPYFKLINNKDFCKKILSEFGVSSKDGLIVNGHVPVKIEKGESPLKDSGMAVTIDGAFSEAYGDKGFTLVLEANRTYLAQHYHFESVKDSITKGTDIVPTTKEIVKYDKTRLVSDTEMGDEIKKLILILDDLIKAYRSNIVREQLVF
jgi:fructose-1,6-bisphosphatase-3